MSLPTIRAEGRHAVYILHLDATVDGFRHYVGITTFDRLGARMIEHTTGRGAKLTKRACLQGVTWRLAHFWRTDDPLLEGALMTRREARQVCPVCRRVSSGIGYRPTPKPEKPLPILSLGSDSDCRNLDKRREQDNPKELFRTETPSE